ncbi:MAG: hypothetical protein A2X19_08585 [Bacteroidetes bacterium GWE2_39_28]|jgi:peptidyl-prolyl cis-trans isomerase SurA|nr:MAG: hypothetical protein A2X19_08585 [Bacteroidetes bacterium GWE2_39_28]OFY12233.1 MAG: hypothetical protein A2X16_06710 [Bacteroidetes bacterium GWF2_39_10]OFZ07927.1 MAG: hypothetical protein A2322_08310 [Bacteroidetes bacterium RIFOXYB2_FULL_39_7]OFZ12289.1 MAG: hypothetical protein A2465_10570 [Bacteroidetes bacterium RIFOXYC2_FULL_39_11]HCT94263.1 hypothetical protein [Rikenellaceae bacterium]
MKNSILKTIVVTAAILSVSPAFSQRYEKGLIDKTIALIGNDMIQLSALEAEVQMMMLQGITSDRNIRCNVLENMLIQKLFLTQARLDSLTANPSQVESELSRRIDDVLSKLGGEKAAEEYFKKPLFRLREEWREALTEQFLTQEMRGNVAAKAPDLSPSDVEKFYKTSHPDSLPEISTQYKYRHIVQYPDKEGAVIAVKERLLEFRERIMKGERFSTLATLYSQDPESSKRGGELGMASKNFFLPAFSDAAMALKEGQVSQIVETEYGYHLIQMIKKEGDMFNARHILIRPEFNNDDRSKAFNKLDSIKTLLINDSITFEQAARKFSHDVKSFVNGGLVADKYSGSAYFLKDQLKPSDYNIIKDLKEGDISEPFETTDDEGQSGNTVYKIIMLEKIIPSHVANFKDDYNELLNKAKNKAAMDEIIKFIEKKKETTFIRIDPLFQNCPFLKDGWLK